MKFVAEASLRPDRNQAEATSDKWLSVRLLSMFESRCSHLRPETLLKRRLWHRRFSVNFKKFLNFYAIS